LLWRNVCSYLLFVSLLLSHGPECSCVCYHTCNTPQSYHGGGRTAPTAVTAAQPYKTARRGSLTIIIIPIFSRFYFYQSRRKQNQTRLPNNQCATGFLEELPSLAHGPSPILLLPQRGTLFPQSGESKYACWTLFRTSLSSHASTKRVSMNSELPKTIICAALGNGHYRHRLHVAMDEPCTC